MSGKGERRGNDGKVWLIQPDYPPDDDPRIGLCPHPDGARFVDAQMDNEIRCRTCGRTVA